MKKKRISNRKTLTDGSKIAVIGGGPSGSFFSFFLLEMAERIDLAIRVDVYESRDFFSAGPPGCNMCGGVISESLVQILAAEGISLHPSVVQRVIESYVLHTNEGSILIRTPSGEKRIGAVFRGKGPKGVEEAEWESFDAHLLGLALGKGANLIKGRVERVGFNRGFPEIQVKGSAPQTYELLAVAAGINSPILRLFEDLNLGYSPPLTIPAYIFEYLLGSRAVDKYLGRSMHTFLLDLPGLEFAAIIPKGDYATVCLLGADLKRKDVESFFARREVRDCLPPEWNWENHACHCRPKMNVKGPGQAYLDRVVFIGDSGTSRLYKDGIGAAYRTAKAAVSSVVFKGLAAEDFAVRYGPTCRKMEKDNKKGKSIFSAVRILKKIPFLRRTILSMAAREQKNIGGPRRLSLILWDLFTGSTSYTEIFRRLFHPAFLAGFIRHAIPSLRPPEGKDDEKKIERNRFPG